MKKPTANDTNATESQFRLSTVHAPVRPQRFLVEKFRTTQLKKTNSHLPEIENALKVDELLATCKAESMAKVVSQKMFSQTQARRAQLEPISLQPLKKTSNKAMMLEVIQGTSKAPTKKEKTGEQSAPNEVPKDYDEGVSKIKELTKQSDNYQIYDQIQRKHEANGKALMLHKKRTDSDILIHSLFKGTQNRGSKSSANSYFEQDSFFSAPIDFEIPKKLGNKHPEKSVFGKRKVHGVGTALRLQFPFKTDFRENEVSLELCKKAFPGMLEAASRVDLNLRQNQSQNEKRTSHEFHLSFNQGLTCESELDFKAANVHFRNFMYYAQEINDLFAIAFTRNKIGINLMCQGLFEEALSEFEENLKDLPRERQFVSLYNVGLCQKRTGRHSEALDTFYSCREWAEAQKVSLAGQRRVDAGSRSNRCLLLLPGRSQGSVCKLGGEFIRQARKSTASSAIRR